MQRSTSDGLPVSYSPYMGSPEFEEYHNTQTVGGSPNFDLYSACLTTSQGPRRPPYSALTSRTGYPGDFFTDHSFVAPAVSSNRIHPMTPPPANVSEAERGQGLTHLNSSVLPLPNFLSAPGGSDSPKKHGLVSWYAPPHHQAHAQANWHIQGQSPIIGQHPGQHLSMSPATVSSGYLSQMATPAYVSPGFGLSNQLDHSSLGHGEMMTGQVMQSTPQSLEHGTPRQESEVAESIETSQEGVMDEAAHGEAGRAEQSGPNEGSRPAANLPYAQLIWRAFLSRPNHAMTLQEIYQWFRENTDKAKDGSKGWQNSIRHNLSMNGAFAKRDRQANWSDDRSHGRSTKKSTEWVLQDWAVAGVQSTTRYRKEKENGAQHLRSGSLDASGVDRPRVRRTPPNRRREHATGVRQAGNRRRGSLDRPSQTMSAGFNQSAISGGTFSPQPAEHLDVLGAGTYYSANNSPYAMGNIRQEYTYGADNYTRSINTLARQGQELPLSMAPEYSIQEGYQLGTYGM
ncbi:hypothetical protein GGS20DRAFT_590258 [Poronia punctata]|nr:hypothetical protein GGS20DRAFT_590258 [Poronia punctata]